MNSTTMDDVFSVLAKLDSGLEDKPLHGPIRIPPPDPPVGDGYDPLWSIRGGTNEERERFRRAARRAVAATGRKFADPGEALDFWLTEVRRFHALRNSEYMRDEWCIRRLLDASANYCAERVVGAVEAGKQDTQTQFEELEQQFKQMALGPGGRLYAIMRREPTECPPNVEAQGEKSSQAPIEDVYRQRAATVARLIEELDILKPQMQIEDESEYGRLKDEYPDYLCFQIAAERRDLKDKILNIGGSSRHIKLAKELAAAQFRLSYATIDTIWRRFKPAELKRTAQPQHSAIIPKAKEPRKAKRDSGGHPWLKHRISAKPR